MHGTRLTFHTAVFFAFSLILFCTASSTVEGRNETVKLKAKQATSSITYSLSHPLHKIEATSREFYCEAEENLERKQLERVSFVADVSTFDSGNSNRDSHAMEVIDALTYPEVRFSSTALTPLGTNSAEVIYNAEGILQFHGVENPVRFRASASATDMGWKVKGTAAIRLTDFKVERPTLFAIPVSDSLYFSFQIDFAR
ncbi:MAG: YceI family protein [Chloroherpetonaceae bacterium]|nr:YceI family protein [Chloroherpetonaceae bacterium]